MLVQRGEHAPECRVGLLDEVPVQSQLAGAFEIRARARGRVRRGQSHVQEERLAVAGFHGIALQERLRFCSERAQDLVVLEVLSGGPHAIERAPALLGCHVALESAVASEHVRVHVQRARQDERVVKAIVIGADSQRTVVVDVVQALVHAVIGVHQRAEVPLANVAGSVAGPLQHRAERERSGGQLGVEKAPRAVLRRLGETPCIATRHDGDARRHADGRHRVGVSEHHSVTGKRVECRSAGLTAVAAVAGDVTDAEVVCHHVDDIGAGGNARERADSKQDEQHDNPVNAGGVERMHGAVGNSIPCSLGADPAPGHGQVLPSAFTYRCPGSGLPVRDAGSQGPTFADQSERTRWNLSIAQLAGKRSRLPSLAV